MIIELHLLQSFPVSNLNRDDVGQPKTATFGGCTRARISSQSLKRAARLLFDQHGLDTAETGVRTKRLLTEAAKVLAERGKHSDDAVAVAEAGLAALGFGIDKNTKLTEYLLFVGRQAVELLADFCAENWDALLATANKKRGKKGETEDGEKSTKDKAKKAKPDKVTEEKAKRILDARRAVDVAMFGRMIADNKDFNVDAASQVAHAISTHAVANEFDYYTAVDDLKPDDESGADMIGTVDFNAACYYRYANLNLAQLAANLDGDLDLVTRGARAWLSAFVHAVPGGKQNSMAALTLPETLLGVVRERGAWNLANAFLRPVTGSDLMATSTARLAEHFERIRGFYGDSQIRSVTAASLAGDLSSLDNVDVASNLDDFIARVLASTKA
ncbi:type I-E CRISPR-associated protein Cas7/Cse4/CasC [Streptoalloteichus hindustanus]|uniref:CRISPR system Cascade subunit CasC n=1 Tax=Streptoalloteichus hindustanus TaxID=2017 RepID=A0A1M5LCZ2_STRHI|nr:type I-E CRISPR-associated protein Cas7/Cse4/CasC [Streptoalloteichus hindustanus]SHG62846.1 CRISPR system Cascade subunit CasC [Streptoalloteichus hindustanus]